MTSSIALVLTVVLLFANAFFVASEFAIVKIRPTRIQELVHQGHRRARLLAGIADRLDAFLSANQLGITLCSLGIGWLGEPALARLIRPLLEGLGGWAAGASHALALSGAFVCITFFHTVVGELAPKSLALQRTEPVALWTAPALQAFYWLAFPLIWTLTKAANLVLRGLGLRDTSEAELLHSPQELRLVLQHARLDPGARRLIDRVFDYTHRVARQVMTLRRDVVVLEARRSFDDNLRVALAHQYTRYPLVVPEGDRVIGYVHLKDIFAALASGRRPKTMAEIVREPIFISEESRLEWLRREFQRRRVHIAVVLGPDHRFSGIVTLEDLIEEFVGEICDEQDYEEIPPIVVHADGSFEVDARVTLDVAARDLGLVLRSEDPSVDTVGAFVESTLEERPLPGDRFDFAGFQLTILGLRDGRIRRLGGERATSAAEVASVRD
ncbi:MAG: hemolysin family protein [Myxococcales bacterium]|nr:hemolysin family protein [Myxococcales bacterium]